jgi:hypothetical protein
MSESTAGVALALLHIAHKRGAGHAVQSDHARVFGCPCCCKIRLTVHTMRSSMGTQQVLFDMRAMLTNDIQNG